MGQRHQVYLRLPKIYYNPNNPNNRGPKTIGIHHQWLYGHTAVHLLANFFRWVKAARADSADLKYTPITTSCSDDVEGLLSALYSVDISRGYYANVRVLGHAEVDNPYTGDNNDGITVIDLSDISKPKYCLYTLDGTEGGSSGYLAPHSIVSARDYLHGYYPELTKLAAMEKPEQCGDEKLIWLYENSAKDLIELFDIPLMAEAELLNMFNSDFRATYNANAEGRRNSVPHRLLPPAAIASMADGLENLSNDLDSFAAAAKRAEIPF